MSAHYPGIPLWAAGFSFGSRTALDVGYNDDRVARMISIGTPIDKYGDYDFLTRTTKPILFIHGDQDEFGAIDKVRELAEKAAANTDVEIAVFKNSGHFFDDHLAELRDKVCEWTKRHLTPKI